MCPRCRQPMVAFELDGVEIDRCLDCGGVWLDGGELETIGERAGVDAGQLTAALHQQTDGGPRTDLKCPRCRRRMSAFSIVAGDRSSRRAGIAAPFGSTPVELDRCPLEHGLWFDAGELQRVIQHFHNGEAGATAEFLADLLRKAV